MSEIQLWPEVNAFIGKLSALYQDQVPGLWEKHELNNVPGASILFNAQSAGPDGLDPDELRYRNPYGNPQSLTDNLSGLVDAGYLEQTGAGRYYPTAKAKEKVTGLIADFTVMFAQPNPAEDADVQRLTGLLQRLVRASEAATPPPPKTALLVSRRLERGPGAPVMAALNRALGDLNAYRDDAHLAAWRGLGVSGIAWESFTAVWNDTAHNAEKLAEDFSFRQYEALDYEGALAELAERGWLARDGEGNYHLTETGRAVREEAEKVTDRTFYAPWNALDESEQAELHVLVGRVGEAFQPAE